MRDIFQADFLRHGDQTVHAHVGHRFVRALHGGGVQFHPAGIRQFHKPSGRAREPFQIGLGKFQAFRFPFGGHGQPVNAAALDDEFRLELTRREEQTVKRGVAEKFRFRRTRRPGLGERAEKIFVRVADPQTGFGREPIQLAQPLCRRFEPRVVEDFRFVVRDASSRRWRPIRGRSKTRRSGRANFSRAGAGGPCRRAAQKQIAASAVCAMQSCSQSTPWSIASCADATADDGSICGRARMVCARDVSARATAARFAKGKTCCRRARAAAGG